MAHASSVIEASINFDNEHQFHIFAEKEIDSNSLFVIDEKPANLNGEELVQLQEGCSYEYELPQGYTLKKNSKIVQPSRRKNHQHTGRLQPNIYVGRLELVINDSYDNQWTIAVEVRSIKADYRQEYRQMLEDITNECTELLMLHSSPVSQSVTIDYESDSQTIYQRFAFVKSLIDSEADIHHPLLRIKVLINRA